MSTVAVYSAVRAYLEASWTDTPLVFENEAADPASSYVYVEVFSNSYDQISIGSGSPSTERWREEGAILLHVHVELGTGGLLPHQHATALTNLLKGLELPGDVRFRGMSIGPGETDGQFFRLTCRAEWVRG